jgi:hypothetical protein
MPAAPKMKTLFALLSALLLPTFAAHGVISITLQPAANTVAIDGSTVTLQVTAVSTNPLEYQWFKGATILTGKNSNKLVLSSVKDVDSATYKVVITEIAATPASAESDAAVLVVNTRPKITIKPVAPNPIPTAEPPSTVSFDVTASGTEPFTFTWQKKVGTTYVPHVAGNATVSAPTTSSSRLTLADVKLLQDAGTYRVSVTNVTGVTVNSTDVVLKINSFPVILTQPAAVLNIATGGTGTLKVVAGGNAPFSYAWFKNNVEIAKTNSPTLTIKGTAPTVVGVPDIYRVEISNAYSPKTVSSNAEVNIINKPKILTQPQKPAAPFNITVAPVNHSLSVGMDVSGNPGNFTYQWQKDGKNIIGAQAATLNFSPIAWVDRGSYKVIVRNEVGTITSTAVTLSIISPPVILSQSALLIYGATKGSVKLSVVAGGTAPLTYEWFYRPVGGSFGTIAIGKAATLALSGLKATQTGDYKCKVTNQSKPVSTGSIESIPIFLQVDDAPTIIAQTAVDGVDTTSTKVRVGNKIHLKITAGGTDTVANPRTYQWQRNNVDIIGQTTNELFINPADFINTGAYRCVVQNFSGKAISNPLTITVQRPPVIVTEPTDVSGIEESRIETGALVASGDPTFVYKWEKRGIGIGGIILWTTVTGQASSKLIFAASQTGQSGIYRCTVKNSVDEATSREVVVNIASIPSPTLGPVVGLSNVEFFPHIARAGEKVRIYGQNLNYTKSVKFGAAVGTFVIESSNSILATVPAGAPLTGTAIEVRTKNPTPTFTTLTFRRSDVANYENDLLNPVILPSTAGTSTKVGDNTFLSLSDLSGRAYYLLHVPKRSNVQVYMINGTVNGLPVDNDLEVFREATAPSTANPSTTFFGADGRTPFPVRANSRSLNIGDDLITFSTDRDNQDVLIEVFGGLAVTSIGYVDFGPFNLITFVDPIPVFSGVATSSETEGLPSGTTINVESETSSWKSSGSDSALTTTELSSDGTANAVRFGGSETSGSESVVLWRTTEESFAGADNVVASFTMSLESGVVGGDDQFAWQVDDSKGEPLISLWVNAADGSIRAVQPDGTTITSAQHITPDGGAHRFEIIVDSRTGTWVTVMDGISVTDPIALPTGALFGDISAVWDLGADGVASGASILFDSFRVEAEVAP